MGHASSRNNERGTKNGGRVREREGKKKKLFLTSFLTFILLALPLTWFVERMNSSQSEFRSTKRKIELCAMKFNNIPTRKATRTKVGVPGRERAREGVENCSNGTQIYAQCETKKGLFLS